MEKINFYQIKKILEKLNITKLIFMKKNMFKEKRIVFFIVFLNFILLVSFPTLINSQEQCTNLSFFDTTPVTITKAKFCSVQLTNGKLIHPNKCCGVNQSTALRNWWSKNKSSSNNETRQKTRQENQQDVIKYTVALLEIKTEVNKYALEIKKNNSADSQCVDASNDILARKITGTNIEMWAKSNKECQTFMNNMRVNLFCAVCDPESDSKINLKTGKCELTKKTCELFTNDCFMAANLNYKFLEPYFKELSNIGICNKEGKYQKDYKHNYKKSFVTNSNAIKECALNNECQNFCESQINFNQKPRSVLDGDPDYLRGVWKNIKLMFEQKVELSGKEQIKDINKIKQDKQNVIQKPDEAKECIIFFLKKNINKFLAKSDNKIDHLKVTISPTGYAQSIFNPEGTNKQPKIELREIWTKKINKKIRKLSCGGNIMMIKFSNFFFGLLLMLILLLL